MQMMKAFFTYFLVFFFISSTYAQVDTAGTREDTGYYRVDISDIKQENYVPIERTPATWIKRNPYKALVAPAALVGLGAILIKNPVYDRFDFHSDLRSVFPNFRGSEIDDFLIYSPYVELVALNLVKIRCENDFLNTGLIILKSEIINLTLTFGLKYLTAIERPNGQDFRAWPSGHTSEAFLAATIVNREFRYRSPWYGIAAYSLAGTVGFFRMLNNKHWLSDVVAGAGIGILSANITYLTHQWRFGRPGTCFVPTFINGKPGLVFSYRF